MASWAIILLLNKPRAAVTAAAMVVAQMAQMSKMLEFTYTNCSKVIGMASITIDIQDTQLQKLQELAERRGLSPEDLLLASVENLLSVPKSEFSQAADYVLKKNTELYNRLS